MIVVWGASNENNHYCWLSLIFYTSIKGIIGNYVKREEKLNFSTLSASICNECLDWRGGDVIRFGRFPFWVEDVELSYDDWIWLKGRDSIRTRYVLTCLKPKCWPSLRVLLTAMDLKNLPDPLKQCYKRSFIAFGLGLFSISNFQSKSIVTRKFPNQKRLSFNPFPSFF